MNRFIYMLIWAATGAVLAVGCRPQQLEPEPDPALGQELLVSFSVRIASVVSPTTTPEGKGAAAGDAWRVACDVPQPTPEGKADTKTALYNLWLFQFNADGSINGTPRQISDNVTPVYDNTILEVPMIVSTNQTVYLLVLGPKLGQNLSSIRSLAELEATEFSYTESKMGVVVSKITSDAEMPFGGKTAGVSVISLPGATERGLLEFDTPTGFDGGIPIRRLMSKVTLSYLFSVDEYTLESIRFLNANTLLRLSNPEKNSPNTDAYVQLMMQNGPVDEHGYQTAYCYVAQNKYGTIESITTEIDRYYKVDDKGVASGMAPEYGSNIEVWAASKLNPLYYALYQIYVGNNNTSNFDVEQNHDYTLRTYINADPAVSKTDGRIREYAFKLGVNFAPCRTVSEVSGTRLGPSSSSRYMVDAHFDRRRLAIYAKGELVRLELFEDEQCTRPLNPATSWVRISSEPNYTLACRATDGFVTQVETEVFVPSRLNFYLYYDEYIDDDPTNLVGLPARSVYIRVSSRYLGTGDVHLANIYQTDQGAARYIGRLGGEIDAATGQYARGLCIDQVNESTISYNTDEVSQANAYGLVYGYRDISTTSAGYDTYNTANGRQATRDLAENPKSLDVANKVTDYILDPPRRKANGDIDLYQYNNYNSFHARFCYDRNRDEDGSGVLEPNEYKWYLPSSSQLTGYAFWAVASGISTFVNDGSSTTESQDLFVRNYVFSIGAEYTTLDWYSNKQNRRFNRCVREVPAKSYPFP